MMSDLVDGVNKFGADWERIKNEYKFTVTMSALKRNFITTKSTNISLWRMASGKCYQVIISGLHIYRNP